MKKNAFTLVELVLSIFLLGLIVYFLYSAVANLQKSNTIFEKRSSESFKNQKILSMLYKDIFYAKTITLSGVKNTFIDMQTTNSLYDIKHPFIVWFLKPDLNKLVRFESTLPFRQMNVKNSPYYHMSIIHKECETFQILQSKKKENMLIYIQFKDEKPLVFEFYKPMKAKQETNTTVP